MEEIVNKVADSGLITIDLEEFYPQGDRAVLDIKEYLWEGIALKEKDFRNALKELDWTQYEGKHVAVFCSEDAIIPNWAFMLIATYLEPLAASVVCGTPDVLETFLFQKALKSIDLEQYKDEKIIIKGCGKLPVPVSAYMELTSMLKPVASSIMFGEPCSTVPVYKRPKQ